MHVPVSPGMVLWVLLSVGPVRSQVHPNVDDDIDQDGSQCNDGPFIRIQYGFDHERFVNWEKGQHKVITPQGSSVRMWCACTEDADKLAVTRDGNGVAMEKPYRNAILWNAREIMSMSDDVYICTDTESNCTSSIIVTVTPEIKVIAENIHTYVDKSQINFTVEYGNSVSVLCSGLDANRLRLSRDEATLAIEYENNSTISYVVRNSDRLISNYVCAEIGSTYNTSITIKVIPAIYLKSRNELITPTDLYYDFQVYKFEYRKSIIELYCSGLHAVKLIGYGENNDFSLEMVNKSTVRFSKIFKIGDTYFNCTDSDFPDHEKRVYVIVTPRMEITSYVHRVGSEDSNISKYGIKLGEPLEIICTGDSHKLDIIYSNENGQTVYPDKGVKITLNETSIKYVLQVLGMDRVYTFYCFKESPSDIEIAEMQVGVLPAHILDFRCISHDGQYLNCTWTSVSDKVTFILSHFQNGTLTRICDKPRSTRKRKFCVLDYEYNYEQNQLKEFTFVLLSCNSFSCSNQTFLIDHLSVVKPAPLWGLEVISTTTNTAVINWLSSSNLVAGKYFTGKDNDYYYKVQYWYSGIEPQVINTSLTTCTFGICEYTLDLPCPGMTYEVRIYQKLKTIGNELWSDPAIVVFSTKIDDDPNAIVDPTCDQEPKKTKEVMTYFVQKLAKELRHEVKQMKPVVRALQDKLAKIRKHLPRN